MKHIFWVIIVLVTLTETGLSQGAIVVPSFRNRQVVKQDNVVAISTLGTGNYFTTTQDGILVTSDFPFPLLVSDSTTAIAGPDQLEGLNVYPNPVANILVLERADHDRQYLVEVFSADGTRLETQIWHVGTDVYQMSLQRHPGGTYLLVISDPGNNTAHTYRVIKP